MPPPPSPRHGTHPAPALPGEGGAGRWAAPVASCPSGRGRIGAGCLAGSHGRSQECHSPGHSQPQPQPPLNLSPSPPWGAASPAPTVSIPFPAASSGAGTCLDLRLPPLRSPDLAKGNQHPKGTLGRLCLFREMLDPQQLGWAFLWGRSLVIPPLVSCGFLVMGGCTESICTARPSPNPPSQGLRHGGSAHGMGRQYQAQKKPHN